MGASDHRNARGPEPPIAARSRRDVYAPGSKTAFGQRSRSQSPGDELVPRGHAARAGRSSAIAVALAGIAHGEEKPRFKARGVRLQAP